MQPADNVFINDEVFYNKDYERHRNVLSTDFVVDAGAHVGVFSIKAATVASKVISIEPSSNNFKLLNYNIKSNHIKNITTVNTALGDYDGDTVLYLQPSSGSNSIVNTSAPNSVQAVVVKIRKLDSLIKELKIERLDFLKIDVEGAELNVLNGALNTLKKYKPFVVMESHPFITGNLNSKIRSFLENLNYSCIEEDPYIYASYDRWSNYCCFQN
ncbi:MAG TPA: FkbM family methyltransferase [Candidatus Sulfotelmatobacter sp.]|nr:FkbM family methyltransferase [Candidatus Sulfotelmatobacter sp.]